MVNALLLTACAALAAASSPPEGLELLGKLAGDDAFRGDNRAGATLSADGRYAHVTLVNDGHLIFDVSGRTPVRVGPAFRPRGVVRVTRHHLDGETLYLATERGEVRVVDVSTPSEPRELATISGAGYAAGMATHAGHLYVGEGSTLRVYRVSHPAHPVLVREVPAFAGGADDGNDRVSSVAIVSGHAYVGVSSYNPLLPRLVIFDLQNPGSPVKLPEDSLQGGVLAFLGIDRMEQVGTRVYAAFADAGVAVLDVTDPAAPTVLGTWQGDFLFNLGRIIYHPHVPSMAVRGDFVYLSVRNFFGRTLRVLDASDPAAMKEVDRYGEDLFGVYAAGGNNDNNSDRLIVVTFNAVSAYSLAGRRSTCDNLVCPVDAECAARGHHTVVCVRAAPGPGPVPVPAPKPASLGCYRYDGTERVLSQWEYAGKGNTVGGCAARCAELRLRLAGLEAGGTCWCGNKLDATRTVSAECDVPCPGDRFETCGGEARVSVVSLDGRPREPRPVTQHGCFRMRGESALQLAYVSETGNTPRECTDVCRSNGFRYAGVMAGSQCLCGNELPRNRGKPHQCRKFQCTGSQGLPCGGASRALVWEVTDDEPSSV